MPTFETADFSYAPSCHVPFRDKTVLERMRAIGRRDFEQHFNPNLKVHVGADFDMALDIFFRIKEASEAYVSEAIAAEIAVDWNKGY